MVAMALRCILLVVSVFAFSTASACTLPPNASDMVQLLLVHINQERARNQLSGFRLDAALTRAAQAHACDNANQNRLSHFGTDGSRPSMRVFRAGYDFQFVTENVAIGYARPELVLRAWLRSPTHRQNVLERRTNELGLGVAVGRDGRLHWVMNGGAR